MYSHTVRGRKSPAIPTKALRYWGGGRWLSWWAELHRQGWEGAAGQTQWSLRMLLTRWGHVHTPCYAACMKGTCAGWGPDSEENQGSSDCVCLCSASAPCPVALRLWWAWGGPKPGPVPAGSPTHGSMGSWADPGPLQHQRATLVSGMVLLWPVGPLHSAASTGHQPCAMGSLALSKYSAVSEAVHTAAGAGAAMGWVSLSFLMLKHSMDPSVDRQKDLKLKGGWALQARVLAWATWVRWQRPWSARLKAMSCAWLKSTLFPVTVMNQAHASCLIH